MALDLSKIKGISDEVKAKIAKTTNREELMDVIKAEGLTEEQMKELAGGSEEPCRYYCPAFDFDPDCPAKGACFAKGCKALPI